MFEIRLTEQLFHDAQRRATEGGFASVDEYVAEVLRSDLEETENLDHLFTPERLAQIARADAQIDAGNYLTLDELDARLERCKTEWLDKNPR